MGRTGGSQAVSPSYQYMTDGDNQCHGNYDDDGYGDCGLRVFLLYTSRGVGHQSNLGTCNGSKTCT